MREEAQETLAYLLARGADYADLRITSRRTQSVGVKNGAVEEIAENSSRGFGIRVLADGAWGFAASSAPGPDRMRRAADLALAIARASALAGGPAVDLAPVQSVEDEWRARYKVDPFEVPLDEKVALLLEAEKRLHVDPRIRVGEARFRAMRESRAFGSTEGSWIEQEVTECGGGVGATAAGGGEVQQRGYPNAHRGHFSCQGYEFFAGLDIAGNAERVGREASALLDAKQCPFTGKTDLILDGRQLALQIHESCGHPVELDRVLGAEAGYAGTSFLTPDKLGRFRYGSPAVTLVADGFLPTGLGTLKYDDEGVPTRKVTLIDQGLFENYLTSRETAPILGQESNGAMRADGWSRIPIIRMNNINLQPGDWDLGELIRDTKHGLYLEVNRSWSIDDRRLNFQFGTEIGWEIRDGALGEMVKNPNYTGLTPEFWGSCDAVCDRDHWQLWGTPNCGKGEPGQVAHVGHGAAPARFRNVRVGVGYAR